MIKRKIKINAPPARKTTGGKSRYFPRVKKRPQKKFSPGENFPPLSWADQDPPGEKKNLLKGAARRGPPGKNIKGETPRAKKKFKGPRLPGGPRGPARARLPKSGEDQMENPGRAPPLWGGAFPLGETRESRRPSSRGKTRVNPCRPDPFNPPTPVRFKPLIRNAGTPSPAGQPETPPGDAAHRRRPSIRRRAVCLAVYSAGGYFSVEWYLTSAFCLFEFGPSQRHKRLLSDDVG